jgi:hypothetical protein
MTLRCLILGHRRSRSRATFDDKHQRWFSDCKRCHVLLVREPDGTWHPAPPQPERLEPIHREGRSTEEPLPEETDMHERSAGTSNAVTVPMAAE